MRVLVTGATGFLGNNICRTLIQQGHRPVAAVRPVSNLRALDGLEMDQITVDVTQSEDLAAAMDGVDAIVHAAAFIHLGWSKLAVSRQVNVENTRRLAQAARRKNIRMVFVSSVDALGRATETEIGTEEKLDPPNPPNNYVVSKREAETEFLLEAANGLDGVIVNPGFMVGPYDWRPSSGEMMLTVYNNFIFFVPAGGCSTADVRDVAAGTIAAVEHGRAGERYILGGQNISYFELWARMARVMKCGGPKRNLRNWMAATAGFVGDTIGKLTGNELLVNSAATQMGQINHYYSSDKAARELGYQIGDIDVALMDAFDWFVANGYVGKK